MDIPDGLGAVLKRIIKAIVDMSPGIAIYTVEDLLKHGLQDMVASTVAIQKEGEDSIKAVMCARHTSYS